MTQWWGDGLAWIRWQKLIEDSVLYNYVENDPVRNTDPDGMEVSYDATGNATYTGQDAVNFALGQQAYEKKHNNEGDKNPPQPWYKRLWNGLKKWATTRTEGITFDNITPEQRKNYAQFAKTMQTFANLSLMVQGHMEMLNTMAASEAPLSAVETASQEIATADIESFAVANQIYSGQKGVNPEVVNEYVSQMENGTFDVSKGAGGFSHEGKYVLTEGNHRMNAAIKYGLKTGDFKYVKELIDNGHWTNANPANYGVKIYNLPVKK